MNYPCCCVDSPDLLGDGFCISGDTLYDGEYNIEEYGWDGGDCIEFNSKYPHCTVRGLIMLEMDIVIVIGLMNTTQKSVV